MKFTTWLIAWVTTMPRMPGWQIQRFRYRPTQATIAGFGKPPTLGMVRQNDAFGLESAANRPKSDPVCGSLLSVWRCLAVVWLPGQPEQSGCVWGDSVRFGKIIKVLS